VTGCSLMVAETRLAFQTVDEQAEMALSQRAI
jgi:hypothetical protein